MAIEMGETVDAYERIERSLEERREPGATELRDLVRRLLNGAAGSAQTLDLERLKAGVYRLRIGGGPVRTLVLKCLKPAIAQTDRLVAERWLPALGLGDRCPRLLAGGAQRDGCWVWHAYEDAGDDTLGRRHEPLHLNAAVTLIAELHTRPPPPPPPPAPPRPAPPRPGARAPLRPLAPPAPPPPRPAPRPPPPPRPRRGAARPAAGAGARGRVPGGGGGGAVVELRVAP